MPDCDKLLVTASPTDEASAIPAHTLAALVRIIRTCGQDPLTQLAGYLMTDDPTYLPDSDHARLLADRIGRDKLLEELLSFYLAADQADDEGLS